MSTYRDDFKQARREALWTAPRAWLLLLAAIVAVYLLLAAVTPLTLGFGWYSGEANIRSFQHVRQVYAEGYDDVNALRQIAANACIAKAAKLAASGDTFVYQQRESQLIAVEQRYNTLAGEYDAYMNDHFRGGQVKPPSLPRNAPPLADAEKAAGC